jgi:alpha-mannosidase
VVHEGLNEYELVAIEDGVAHELALTLLRSTGMLSRLGMEYRPLPAGPLTAVPGLQLLGSTLVARYGIDVSGANPYDLVQDLSEAMVVLPSLGGGTRAGSGSSFTVAGAQISSLRRVAGHLELRVFNPEADPCTVTLPGRSGALIDLRGTEVGRFEDALELAPHRFATIRFDEG